jgi:uncharacterized SAM-binding protein YcdF (DUF218 family)
MAWRNDNWKAKRVFFWLFVSWLFIVSISPLPQLCARQLESAYYVFDASKIRSGYEPHIMILGSGHALAPDLSATNQLSMIALGRLSEAIRIKNLIPSAKIICSGFSSSGRVTQGEMLALAALELGVSSTDTLILNSPERTQEEADQYNRRFGKRHQLIVVTDAIHMPRAMRHFRMEGLTPDAAPTNYLTKVDTLQLYYNFKVSVSKIDMSQKVMHEYAGLLESALLGF